MGALVFPVCLTRLSCPVHNKMGSVLDRLDFKLARKSKSMELGICARSASWATESNLHISASPKEGLINGKEWLGRRVTVGLERGEAIVADLSKLQGQALCQREGCLSPRMEVEPLQEIMCFRLHGLHRENRKPRLSREKGH